MLKSIPIQDIKDENFDYYNENGILKVILDEGVKKHLSNFLKETSTWLNHFLGFDIGPHEVQKELPKIAKVDRTAIARLYKVSRRFPSIKRIACSDTLESISKRLMNTGLSSCCNFTNVRFDLPDEEKFLLPPHQDFPYIQGSKNGVTWWIPFFNTDTEMGPPSVVLGSHKKGVFPVAEIKNQDSKESKGKSFLIKNLSSFNDCNYLGTNFEFGEAIVFHTLLLHRSEKNNSAFARLNLQARFDDALDLNSYGKNYPEGLYLGDEFSVKFPEYFK